MHYQSALAANQTARPLTIPVPVPILIALTVPLPLASRYLGGRGDGMRVLVLRGLSRLLLAVLLLPPAALLGTTARFGCGSLHQKGNPSAVRRIRLAL